MAHNGIVYLLHFDRSYRHARHYIGFTQNLEQRLEEHRAGRGSPLVAAAIADGIDFQLAAIWEGDRHEGVCVASRHCASPGRSSRPLGRCRREGRRRRRGAVAGRPAREVRMDERATDGEGEGRH